MRIVGLCAFWWLSGGVLFAADRVDYVRGVKPIFAARCYACHGALEQKNGLRLDTIDLMKKGGENGPAIIPGSSAESRLVDHITGKSGARRMPPKSEGEGLDARQIATIKAWIDQGAVGPADEKPEPDPRAHWAFKAPVRVALPKVKDAAWVKNPIDAIIAAEHEKRGLVPQRLADKSILLRRVYLDLIGLPPTRDELTAFLKDESPDSYEKVVDRLLASKQYGERWGRHWMDIWRYSDWWGLGAEVRNSQKHIWHWRDWIIESLNADKGYDQMLREMLAADELYPNDLDRLRATGFLARSYFIFNHNSWMEEVVEHTSKAFLGVTLNCARCHDHKYDPFKQQDYYRFRAFFEPYQVRTDMVAGEADFGKDGIPRVFDCNLNVPTYLFVRGDEKQPKKDRPLAPGVPEILSLGRLDIKPVSLPPEGHSPGLRPFVLENHLKAAKRQIAAARQALDQARKTLAEIERTAKPKKSERPPAKLLSPENARLAVVVAEKALAAVEAEPAALRARAAADRARFQQPAPSNAKELARQAARAERLLAVVRAEEKVARVELAIGIREVDPEKKLGFARDDLMKARQALDSVSDAYTPLRGSLKTPESNLETEASRNKPYPTTSTGRRYALAKWLTDPRHPLTARVAVNHIWMRHFGKPLVPTVFDFGRKGTPPTHPELLDYLATELMTSSEVDPRRGWSMKYLNRLIVTSRTYRLTSSSAGATVSVKADPENRYYWRRNPLRMEAQVVRDSLLSLAGDLDLTLGGPSVPAADETSRRRSLYFVHSHNEHNRFLSMFDDANVLECYQRAESIVPQQALALENSGLALSAAEKIARRLTDKLDSVSDAAFVRAAFETVLSNRPTAEEQGECERALKQLKVLAGGDTIPGAVLRARTNLVHALLNHNDFLTVR
jgi:hypothetical protein